MKQDSSAVGALVGRLRAEVAALRPGDRLPSTRTITAAHQVGPVTVTRALQRLAAEGVVVTRPGSGTFVAHRRAPVAAGERPDLTWQAVALGGRSVDADGVVDLLTPAPAGVIPLTGGYLAPGLQPVGALTAAMNRAVRRPDAWERPPLPGLRELRAFFAATAGADVAPSDVTITGGGQAAVTLALRAVLPAGAPLLVESPTYLGALACARAAGVRPVPVPIDDGGLRPDLLAEAFAVTGARAVYCQPTFHNPTGGSLRPDRRADILDVARAAGAFVIEDDFARHLAMTSSPPPPPLIRDDREGVVVHIASLTKATCPSLRVAAVVARGPVAERIAATQFVDAFFVARPLQEAAVELVTTEAWPRHLRALSGALRRRRDILLAALGSPVPPPGGGMHVWVPLADGADEAATAEAARRAGVLISTGRPFFPAEAPGPFARLSFGIAATEAELAEGARRVAGLLAPR